VVYVFANVSDANIYFSINDSELNYVVSSNQSCSFSKLNFQLLTAVSRVHAECQIFLYHNCTLSFTDCSFGQPADLHSNYSLMALFNVSLHLTRVNLTRLTFGPLPMIAATDCPLGPVLDDVTVISCSSSALTWQRPLSPVISCTQIPIGSSRRSTAAKENSICRAR
jgi:hypothetical protein